MTKLPTINQFTMKALAGGYTTSDIETIISMINDKRDKLQNDLKQLKELEKLARIVAETKLANSVENEILTTADNTAASGIVIESTNDEAATESTKVM